MPRPAPGVGLVVDSGQVVLVAAVLAALAWGLWRVTRDGRFRGARRAGSAVGTGGADPADHHATSLLDDTPWAGAVGARATLLQFSSAFCAPCRATRHVLADVAQSAPGVVHVEVDAEQHLDLVRRLGVVRTPTTVILDPSGREVARAAGAPRKSEVLTALAEFRSRDVDSDLG